MTIDEPQNDPDDWMTALLRSPIFQHLPPTNLQKILMSLEAVHFRKGETIVDQGETGDYYYLIKNGRCVLTRKPSPNAKEIKLAELADGDTFGEDSLLSGAPRNVTITALTDISLLRLNKTNFVSLIKEPSLKFVDYAQMQEAVKQGAVLLDVRNPDEYKASHLDGSINEPFFSLRMQLKTLNRGKTFIVVCGDGKTSEAAVFLLLRHKINAMILQGGMAGVETGQAPVFAPAASSRAEQVPASETIAVKRPEPVPPPAAATPQTHAAAAPSGALDAQILALQAQLEAYKTENQQLSAKCMKLEFDKQHAEKQVRVLHKQLEKMTQVLDRLKGGTAG